MSVIHAWEVLTTNSVTGRTQSIVFTVKEQAVAFFAGHHRAKIRPVLVDTLTGEIVHAATGARRGV